MKITGFTLLEVILYVALFGVLMSGALICVYELLENTNKQSVVAATIIEGTFINQKLSWGIFNAKSIIIQNASTIEIIKGNGSTSTKIIFQLKDGNLFFTGGAIFSQPLLGSDFIMSNLIIKLSTSTAQLPPKLTITYQLNNTPFFYETYVPSLSYDD